MVAELGEEAAGIPFGTEVTVKRHLFPLPGKHSHKGWLSLSGKDCSPIKLQFAGAQHNHHDELIAYRFSLLSGDEVWIEFSDDLDTSGRIKVLRELMDW